MRVAVVGTGYVGLVTGACLAHLGHEVTCLDTDPAKIRSIQSGNLPIYEPGLDEMVAELQGNGRLRFVDTYSEAIPTAQTVFICVGTPALPSGQADTSYVESAAREIGRHLGPDYCVLINKSTVPIGSGDWVGMLVRQGLAQRGYAAVQAGGRAEALASEKAATAVAERQATPTPVEAGNGNGKPTNFDVVSNPEFLREGTAIEDALNPDRIVIGAESERAVERMRQLYAPLLERNLNAGREVPFVVTDRASAEMIKYASNAFLATKISFINEIANICERVGADVKEVARGIGMDNRIGPGFLSAGIGWGGSCFPKDLASLTHTAHEYGYEAHFLEMVQEVNRQQRYVVIRKLQERLKLIKGKTIAIWGLAFKPGTDDLREAPALAIIARLNELGAAVRVYDPKAMEGARLRGLQAEFCDDAYAAAEDADAVVLVTEWPEFRELDWPRVRTVMRRPLIVDGRNSFDRATLLWHGFDYCGIGR